MPRGKILSDVIIKKLVEVVKKHPVIYDASDKSRMDAQKVSETWDSIAQIFNIPGIDGKGWRAKWRNLRDNYVKQRRHLREKGSGDAGRIKKKWKFFDLLSFLEPFIRDIAENELSAFSSLEDSDSFEITPCVVKSEKRKRSDERSTENDNSSFYVSLNDYSNEIRKNHDPLIVNADRDAENLLFESYALRLKNLPTETQAFVKLQMSQIFFNAENPNVSPVPVTPLPSNIHCQSLAEINADQ